MEPNPGRAFALSGVVPAADDEEPAIARTTSTSQVDSRQTSLADTMRPSPP